MALTYNAITMPKLAKKSDYFIKIQLVG